MKSVVLIKIGGSLITDKQKQFVLRKRALKKISQEVARAFKESGKLLVVGHGAGSFGHVPAEKYQTISGIIDEQSLEGMVRVRVAAGQLNRIVVEKFVEVGVPAVPISPSSCFVAKGGSAVRVFAEPVELLLKNGLLPVVYGDVVLDREQGFTILSTEKVLGLLALALKRKGWAVERLIHCGITDGVYDGRGKTVAQITSQNFKRYKKMVGKSGGTDVTGGMLHKVEEALELAQKGIPSFIIDGTKRGNLSKAVMGKKVEGTKISS